MHDNVDARMEHGVKVFLRLTLIVVHLMLVSKLFPLVEILQVFQETIKAFGAKKGLKLKILLTFHMSPLGRKIKV